MLQFKWTEECYQRLSFKFMVKVWFKKLLNIDLIPIHPTFTPFWRSNQKIPGEVHLQMQWNFTSKEVMWMSKVQFYVSNWKHWS